MISQYWNDIFGTFSLRELLVERFTFRSTKQRQYAKRLEKRFSDTYMHKKMDKALAVKRQRTMQFLDQVQADIEELEATEAQRHAEKLGKKMAERDRKRRDAFQDKWDKRAEVFFAKVDNSETTKEVDALDREYHKEFVKYWKEKQEVEEAHLDDLWDAAARVHAAFETWRERKQSIQNPMLLKREMEEAVAFAFLDALLLLEAKWGEDEPEGEFLLLLERKRIDHKKEWAKIREWLRKNQYRVSHRPKGLKYMPTHRKNTVAYNRVMQYLTKLFNEVARGADPKVDPDKHATLMDAAHKKAYQYLRKKKTEWEKILSTRKEESETPESWWSTILG